MKVSRLKSFAFFALYACPQNFLILKFKMVLFKYGFKTKYNIRESARNFCKVLRVQLATKLFCLETFMVYSIAHVVMTPPVYTV